MTHAFIKVATWPILKGTSSLITIFTCENTITSKYMYMCVNSNGIYLVIMILGFQYMEQAEYSLSRETILSFNNG